MDAFTLKKHKESGELHLFKGKMPADNPDYKCTSTSKSICKKMEKSDSEKNIFSCKTESEARIESAKVGRKVCGTCVSTLYTTY